MNHDHLLLALHDGAGRAEKLGVRVIAEVLHAIADSLAESVDHADDPRWRSDEIKDIYNRGSGAA